MSEVRSGWVKGNFHRKTDWHWFPGGEVVDGVVRCLCGYDFSLMAERKGVRGMQQEQDFPPRLWARPTCRECRRILLRMMAEV